MKETFTSADVIARANNARNLLDDPTLQKAFEGVRQQFLAALEASELGNRDAHHEIALSLQALRTVRRQLERWVTDGEVERHRIETRQ